MNSTYNHCFSPKNPCTGKLNTILPKKNKKQKQTEKQLYIKKCMNFVQELGYYILQWFILKTINKYSNEWFLSILNTYYPIIG